MDKRNRQQTVVRAAEKYETRDVDAYARSSNRHQSILNFCFEEEDESGNLVAR